MYHYRNLEMKDMANKRKIEFVKYRKTNIDKSTARYESKFNLFV